MSSELIRIIKWHINRYKIREVRDIYKLLYQGILGNLHYTSLENNFLEDRLKDELDSLIDDFREPLIEEIYVDKRFVRVNLRPFKWYELSIEKLISVMTAPHPPIDKSDFVDMWKHFGKILEEQDIFSFELDDFYEFDMEMEKHNYPAVHHSHSYTRRNHPAYRVVKREAFINLFSIGK